MYLYAISALKMGGEGFSETFITFCQTTLGHILEFRIFTDEHFILIFVFVVSNIIGIYKAFSKKDRTVAIKTLLLILQHFYH
jgi:hypothetical protein